MCLPNFLDSDRTSYPATLLNSLNWTLGLEMTAKKQKEMAENLVKLVARKKHFIQKTIFWVLTFDVLKN